MTERWHPTSALVGLPGMPAKSTRSITLHGPDRGFVSRQGSRGLEWLESSLPAETQAALATRTEPDQAAPTEAEPAPRQLITGPRAAKAQARLWILLTFDDWRAERGGPLMDAMRAFCAAYSAGEIEAPDTVRTAFPRLAWNTLQLWRNAQAKDGLQGLAGRKAGRPAGGTIDADPELADFIVAHIAARPTHIKVVHIDQAMRARFGAERCPSYGALKRWVRKWRETNARTLSLWSNPDSHRGRFRPAFGEADSDVTRANQLWELDGSPADVQCNDGNFKRAALIDVGTRRAIVVIGRTATSALNAALFRKAVLAWGKPERVRSDRGPDMISMHMRAVIERLGAVHEICDPDKPYQKPHVERFFRTLGVDVDERLPGFKGHSIAEQQAIRAQIAHGARRGKDDSEIFEVELGSAELLDRYDAWIETLYHQRLHDGLGGRTPAQAAAGQPFVQVDERLLDILLAEPAKGGGLRTVNKDGLHIDGGIYAAPELGAMVGEKVEVRLDPSDLGRVWVFAPDGAFLCEATDVNRLGTARRDLAVDAGRQAREADNAGRALRRDLLREHRPGDSFGEVMDAARARHEADNVRHLPGRGTADDSAPSREAARALDAGKPKGGHELTPEMQAAADRLFREMEERAAAGPQAPAFDPPWDPDSNVVPLPLRPKEPPVLTGPGGRPFFHDDAQAVRWLLGHPEAWDDDDRAWLEEQLSRRSFRDLLDLGDASLEELVALHRNA